MDEKIRKLERLAALGDPDAIERLQVIKQRIAFKRNYSVEGHDAHTLDPSVLGMNDSGWHIEGDVHEDYYEWVNEFKATHNNGWEVWGDFEDIVYATSEEAFNHFIDNHPPNEWDYQDI